MRGIDNFIAEAIERYGYKMPDGEKWLLMGIVKVDGIEINAIHKEAGELILTGMENKSLKVSEVKDLLSLKIEVGNTVRNLSI